MKLLIDEMYPPFIASTLRKKHKADAVAVLERSDLRGLPDSEIFEVAQREQRAIVTENARDFRPIARDWQAAGRVHHGLILTTNRRFPRARPRSASRLILALASLLRTEPGSSRPSNREVWL